MSADGAISKDLLDTFASYDVLETFNRLPALNRDRFLRWISSARDDESKWLRVEAFVLALKLGPLGPKAETPSGTSEGVG